MFAGYCGDRFHLLFSILIVALGKAIDQLD